MTVTEEAGQSDQSGPSGQCAEAATVPQYQADELDIEENEAAATQHDSDSAENEAVATQHDLDSAENEPVPTQHYSDSAEKPSDYPCIFCQKMRKKYHGREQPLQTCITMDAVNNLISIANDMDDEQLINRITEMSAGNQPILYHKICKLNYTNELQQQKKLNTEKTEWHQTRNIHKLAFEDVCSFISDNIVRKKNSYFLDFLQALFAESVTIHDPTKSTQVGPYNFESRLVKAFPKKINVVIMNGKKIVKPYTGVLIKTDYNALQEDDILDRAVLILPKKYS
ncbi:hypothetical protein ACJJTC_002714 [Scirpophaga incertulas]